VDNLYDLKGHELLEPLVDMRFELEEDLSEAAWSYPSYGWNWDKQGKDSRSSYGTHQAQLIKDARDAFADAEEGVREELKANSYDAWTGVAEDLKHDISDIIKSHAANINQQGGFHVEDAFANTLRIATEFENAIHTSRNRWEEVIHPTVDAYYAAYESRLAELKQADPYSYSNHHARTDIELLNNQKKHFDERVYALTEKFENSVNEVQASFLEDDRKRIELEEFERVITGFLGDL
jgi:gas vesicle protein